MSQLQQLLNKVQQAPSLRDAIVLAQDRWAKNYELVTGKKDGKQRFETELLNYLDIVAEKPELAKVQDKFSHFAAVMKAAVTGLSFKSDGHLYPIPSGGKVKVQIGAHGKREMLRQMKDIKFVNEAQLVKKGDEFVHDKLNNTIIKHVTTDKSVTTNKLEDIIAAYCRIEFADGRKVDVVVYQDELIKAKNASKNKGEGSTWDTWTGEMCKKVTYHRAKKLYHRYPEGIEFNIGDDDNEDSFEDIPHSEEPFVSAPDNVDESTGEVLEPEVQQTKPKRETSKAKTEDVEPFA